MVPRLVVGLVATALLAAGCASGAPSWPFPAATPLPAPSSEPSTPASAPGPTESSGPPAPSPSSTRPVPSTPPPTVIPTTKPTATKPPASAPPTTRPPATTPPTTKPPAACTIPSSLRGKDLNSIPTSAKVIALTFDGGGDNAGTASVLATLADTGKPATFFLTGQFAQRFPDAARRIAARYPIGNHTQTHPALTQESDARVVEEIRTGAASIKAATGVDPRPYFRFPFGDRDARTIGLVNSECYVPFRWTVDSLGWKGTVKGGMTAQKVTQRVLDGATNGGIILMHLGQNPDDGTTLDADALPAIIVGLRERGYTLVTLEQVLPATP